MGILDFLSAGAAGVGVAPPSASTIAMQAPARKFGVKDIFGILGDALLQGNDMAPEYSNRLKAQDIADASTLLNDPATEAEGLKRIFGLDPKLGADVQQNLMTAQKARAEAAAKADAERKAALEVGRTQALNQLKAGVPRDVVEAAAAKKGVDISDVPTDPATLEKYLRGTLGIKDQYELSDKEADNQRADEYNKNRIRLGEGRLAVSNRNAATSERRAATGERNARTSERRADTYDRTAGKGGKATSSGEDNRKIRINPRTNTIEYKQPDGTWKTK